ncbi:unnamed protein product (macronuclear) [Paramecium tetraurelia]|uniref:Uncharacterized protein n=1 Tax=Paramecium tetraurelia TaxID=5888 RepID=A0D651_PARTE|nr:uncharacterized protein GSPATT00013948001 [Paramecium tetraurelia]CAK78518.1 unnamed protein product [Paramecium tetraurelia]|eukprot:XP_001445915.1 hypothetical protein (macronuclear) [Paramecium tetraurelia strain d4-2]
MNQFESNEARILYLIYTLYQNNTISLDQKGILKGTNSVIVTDYLITKGNGRFMNAITSFEQSKDIDQLSQFLIQFVDMENSLSDYVSVDSYKTIKSSKPCELLKETTQSSNTNSNQYILFSPVLIQKKNRDAQFISRKDRKYLTQIQ